MEGGGRGVGGVPEERVVEQRGERRKVSKGREDVRSTENGMGGGDEIEEERRMGNNKEEGMRAGKI